MKTSIRSIGLLATLAMGLASPLFSQVPDLTKDTQSVDRKLTYNLGATGLRGWIYTKAANNLDAAHFQEGIAAAVGLAITQGGHGRENRTGEIMKMVTGYGSAAKPQIPALRELIVSFNAEVERREYPGGELNNRGSVPWRKPSRLSKPPRILSTDHSIHDGMPYENIMAYLKAGRKYGVYRT